MEVEDKGHLGKKTWIGLFVGMCFKLALILQSSNPPEATVLRIRFPILDSSCSTSETKGLLQSLFLVSPRNIAHLVHLTQLCNSEWGLRLELSPLPWVAGELGEKLGVSLYWSCVQQRSGWNFSPKVQTEAKCWTGACLVTVGLKDKQRSESLEALFQLSSSAITS